MAHAAGYSHDPSLRVAGSLGCRASMHHTGTSGAEGHTWDLTIDGNASSVLACVDPHDGLLLHAHTRFLDEPDRDVAAYPGTHTPHTRHLLFRTRSSGSDP